MYENNEKLVQSREKGGVIVLCDGNRTVASIGKTILETIQPQ